MSEDASASELPTPSFDVLVHVLATPVYVHLGLLENPQTGARDVDLAQARWALDLLHVLDECSAASRTSEQSKMLGELLHRLRGAYASAQG